MSAILSRLKARQRGQALPEYVVGTMVVYWALFQPIQYSPFNGQSVVAALVDSFQQNHRAYEFALSQPTLE